MKFGRVLAAAFAFLLFACQPTRSPAIILIDKENIITLRTDERDPSALLRQAGVTLGPKDRLLLNGFPTRLHAPITTYPITLQIRRAVNMTIDTPEGKQQIQSSALTIGEALQEASIWLRAGDKSSHSLISPVSSSHNPQEKLCRSSRARAYFNRQQSASSSSSSKSLIENTLVKNI